MTDRKPPPWIVYHRQGWCALPPGAVPDPDACNDPTLCGYVVTMRGGSKRGKPDCPECLAVLAGTPAAGEGRPVSNPKPPSPRSVSATLRTAGFRAIGDGDEGYEAGWFRGDPASGLVHVSFHSYRERVGAAAMDAVLAFEQEALASMMAALRHKGWVVEAAVPPTYLIVRAEGEQ